MRSNPRTVADLGPVLDHRIRIERDASADLGAPSNARRRIDRWSSVLGGIKSRQQLEQRGLRLGDDDTRSNLAWQVRQLRSHESHACPRARKCRRVTAVAEESDLRGRRAAQWRYTLYFGALVTTKFASDQVCNGTSGERACTLTAW